MRPIGVVQRQVLGCLVKYGTDEDSPYPSGGWLWTTPSETIRILESLVRRGLVESRDREWLEPEYRITDAGRAELGLTQSS